MPDDLLPTPVWAARVAAAADQIPRMILQGNRWIPNPAYTVARRQASAAFLAACGVLNITPAEAGPCVACGAVHRLYGETRTTLDGTTIPPGNPLCPSCLHTVRSPSAKRPTLTVIHGGGRQQRKEAS